MKKIVSLLFVIAVVFTSCTADQGPMGPPGFDGADGADGDDGGIIAFTAFEETVNFNAADNFSHTVNYGFDVLESDVTLVYILWEKLEDETKVWRLLTQTVQLDEGLLFYNYDFTQTDVRFFLDATFDLNLLSSGDTQNQVFRVVVVPADKINGIDISNYNDVIQASNITSFDIK